MKSFIGTLLVVVLLLSACTTAATTALPYNIEVHRLTHIGAMSASETNVVTQNAKVVGVASGSADPIVRTVVSGGMDAAIPVAAKILGDATRKINASEAVTVTLPAAP